MKVALLAGGLGTRIREETEFRPTIGSSDAAAEVGTLLRGMAVVALEHDNRFLPQTEFVELREEDVGAVSGGGGLKKQSESQNAHHHRESAGGARSRVPAWAN